VISIKNHHQEENQQATQNQVQVDNHQKVEIAEMEVQEMVEMETEMEVQEMEDLEMEEMETEMEVQEDHQNPIQNHLTTQSQNHHTRIQSQFIHMPRKTIPSIQNHQNLHTRNHIIRNLTIRNLTATNIRHKKNSQKNTRKISHMKRSKDMLKNKASILELQQYLITLMNWLTFSSTDEQYDV